jgi:hypothetical protein
MVLQSFVRAVARADQAVVRAFHAAIRAVRAFRAGVRASRVLAALLVGLGAHGLILGSAQAAGNNPIDETYDLNCDAKPIVGVLTRSFEKIQVNVPWASGSVVTFKFTEEDCQGNGNC